MSDIVERLECNGRNCCLDAKSEIERLMDRVIRKQEEIDRLRAALKRTATACMDHDCCVAHAVARKALGETDE